MLLKVYCVLSRRIRGKAVSEARMVLKAKAEQDIAAPIHWRRWR